MAEAWYIESDGRWRRNDGAVVRYAMGLAHLDWIAYEPDPSEQYLSRTNGRRIWPRRWGSAKAAMRAVDREYPAITKTTRLRPQNARK